MLSLRIVNCSLSYERALAVDDVSIEMEEGSICCLIGANGAGKSTIMKAVSGLIQVNSGEIWYGEHKISGMTASEIVKLGVVQVPEGRRLFPHMSVMANLNLGATLRRDKAGIRRDRERVFGYFPRLADRRNQDAGTLSGGEQQMLAIARGLMANPKLLLLDEPSVGLSPLLIAEVKRIIKSIHEDGIAVLLVEQNAFLALGVAQKGYVLQVGKVALAGPIAELRNSELVQKAYFGD
jgi:branched-chain amino acid transport system ATP-binding protein